MGHKYNPSFNFHLGFVHQPENNQDTHSSMSLQRWTVSFLSRGGGCWGQNPGFGARSQAFYQSYTPTQPRDTIDNFHYYILSRKSVRLVSAKNLTPNYIIKFIIRTEAQQSSNLVWMKSLVQSQAMGTGLGGHGGSCTTSTWEWKQEWQKF